MLTLCVIVVDTLHKFVNGFHLHSTICICSINQTYKQTMKLTMIMCKNGLADMVLTLPRPPPPLRQQQTNNYRKSARFFMYIFTSNWEWVFDFQVQLNTIQASALVGRFSSTIISFHWNWMDIVTLFSRFNLIFEISISEWTGVR